MMRRVAAAATGASLGYAAYTWSELRAATPALSAEDASRTLLLHRIGGGAPAHCASLPRAALDGLLPPSRGNYPVITPEVLDALIARVGGLDAGGQRAFERASGAWGAERLLLAERDGDPPVAWLGARVHAPRWVGDEQRVELCLACAGIMPRLFLAQSARRLAEGEAPR